VRPRWDVGQDLPVEIPEPLPARNVTDAGRFRLHDLDQRAARVGERSDRRA
jgi:hypothetical protein